ALGVLEVGAYLEEAARVVAGAGQVAGRELVRLADVEDLDAAAVGQREQAPQLLGRHLLDALERLAHEVGQRARHRGSIWRRLRARADAEEGPGAPSAVSERRV